MGSQQSSFKENSLDSSFETVKISNSVLKRLEKVASLIKLIRDGKDIDSWNQERQEEESNREEWNVNYLHEERENDDNLGTVASDVMQKEYTATFHNVKKMFSIEPKEYRDHCDECKHNLLACYNLHSNEVLKCSKEVAAFMECAIKATENN